MAALIALVLVDGAVILMATFVDRILADAPSKEALATVARNRSVMFACVKSRVLSSDGSLCVFYLLPVARSPQTTQSKPS